MIELSVRPYKIPPGNMTAAGWFGFSDEKIWRLTRKGLREGWTDFKLRVVGSRRTICGGEFCREELGPENRLKRAGYSIGIFAESRERYAFPRGCGVASGQR